MSGGAQLFFDDNEFGSASAADATWETVGASMLPNGEPVEVPFAPSDFSANGDFGGMREFEPIESLEVNTSSIEAPMRVESDFSADKQIDGVVSTDMNGVPPTDRIYTPPSMSSTPLRPATANSSRRSSTEDLQNNVVLRQWENDHAQQLEKKREAEDKLQADRRKEAQTQLAEWYKNRDSRLQKIRQQNRLNESQEAKIRLQAQSSDLKSNTNESWTRVCELIEFTSDGSSSQVPSSSKLAMQEKSTPAGRKTVQGNGVVSPAPKQSLQPPNTKDTSRMRQILLQCKSESPCPQLVNGVSSSH